MKKKDRYNIVLRLILLVFIAVLQFNSNVFGQGITQRGAQISDGSAPNTLNPIPFSILELNSKERGFLMPRMTMEERINIPVDKLNTGLVIYNTTLGCIEFYNGTRRQWMNICGQEELAVFDIPDLKCSEAKTIGTHVEGVFLDERKNILMVEVNVSSPGVFEVDAIAYDNMDQLNGYSFSAKGVFPDVGNFVLVLKGKGTPKKGYARDVNGVASAKDKIRFRLNNKIAKCIVENEVDKDIEPLAATFVCSDPINKIVAEGIYKESIPLNVLNIIKVPIKVTKKGRGRMYGNVVTDDNQLEVINYESDLVDFDLTIGNAVQWVILKPVFATGKPTGGNLKMNFKIVSNGKNEYDPLVPKVPTTISGCSFIIPVQTDGPRFGINRLLFESIIKGKSSGGVGTPYVTPRTYMGTGGSSNFYMEAYVTPKSGGLYIISTDIKNGIYFKGERAVTTKEANTGAELKIVMKAYGTSLSDLPSTKFIATINNVDSNLTKTAAVNVDFVYRPMKMYSVGNFAYHPGGIFGGFNSGPDLIMNSTVNFAWNGLVRIDGLTLVTAPPLNGNTEDFATNASVFNSKIAQVDIFVNGGKGYQKGQSQMTELVSRINNNQVVAVFVEGNNSIGKDNMIKFLKTINGTTENYVATNAPVYSGDQYVTSLGTSNGQVSATLGTTLFSNKFLISYPPTIGSKIPKMEGVNVGIGLGGGFYLDKIPSDFDVLLTAGAGKHNAFIHKTKGLVVVCAEGFMGGRADKSTDETYPASTRSGSVGVPDVNNGIPAKLLYNSYFLLNLVYWAIDHAQENVPAK